MKSSIDGDGDSGTVGIVADTVSVTADDALHHPCHCRRGRGGLRLRQHRGRRDAIGISLARNTITSEVEAYIADADGLAVAVTDFGVTAAAAGGITVRATEAASIRAISIAASVAAGFGAVGVAVAGAGADANNVIRTSTRPMSTEHAEQRRPGRHRREATSADIDATVVSVPRPSRSGIYGGVGAAIGVAIARNYIGWTRPARSAHTYTTACSPATIIKDQTVKIAVRPAAGNVYRYIGDKPLTRPTEGTAAENRALAGRAQLLRPPKWQQVNLDPDAAEIKAYIARFQRHRHRRADGRRRFRPDHRRHRGRRRGGAVGRHRRRLARGAGAASENRIADARPGLCPGRQGRQGHRGRQRQRHGRRHLGIEAFTGGIAVAAAFGAGGMPPSIGVGIAFNEIDNDVEAFVKDVDAGRRCHRAVSAASRIEAHEDATDRRLRRRGGSSPVGVGGIAGALSGAGAFASNVIHGSAQAHADEQRADQRRRRHRSIASDTATIRAEVLALSAAIGLGGAAGAGLSIGVSIAAELDRLRGTGKHSPTQVAGLRSRTPASTRAAI